MGGRDERWRAALWSAVVLGGVLSPLLQYRRPATQRRDGFPLSWYPMFSARRPRRVHIVYVAAVRADGSHRTLPHALLGPAGLNQVRRQLNRVVREGRQQECATTVAAAVAARRGLADAVAVQVLRGRFDLDGCLLEGTVRGTVTVLATAAVVREVAREVAL